MRKIQNVEPVDGFIENKIIRLQIKMCSGLVLIPLKDIYKSWLIITENSLNNEQYKIFHVYFVQQWLKNAIMSI